VPEEQVDVLVALAEEDDDEPIDDTVPVASPDPAMTPPPILGRSIDPVSLNPDPLLGFLRRTKTKRQFRRYKNTFRTPGKQKSVTPKNATPSDDPAPPLTAVIQRGLNY